ncbi:Armadillo type fold [Pelomyxa schiedti]|nr:Armadillo type fold [Pelomyxa schiedti]
MLRTSFPTGNPASVVVTVPATSVSIVAPPSATASDAAVESALDDVTPRSLSSDALVSLRAKFDAGQVGAGADLERLASNVVRLLAEDTYDLQWKHRVLLGYLAVDIAKARPQLRDRLRGEMLALANRLMGARQKTRQEYYGDGGAPDGVKDLAMLPTEGWGSLEVSVWAAGQLVPRLFAEEEPESPATLELALSCARHANRYVRQAGFCLAQSVLGCETLTATAKGRLHATAIGSGLVPVVARGLCDPWPQVRFTAAFAARNFLELDSTPNGRRVWIKDLLAPLFVCRHDFAEGVRRTSHVNWRRAVGMVGKQLLAQNAALITEFLLSSEMAETHEERVAVCESVGEFAALVSRDAVQPHAKALGHLLVLRLKDSHWNVRLAACNSLHDFVAVFPDELLADSGDNEAGVVRQLLGMLGDEISGVREAAAAAIGACARSTISQQCCCTQGTGADPSEQADFDPDANAAARSGSGSGSGGSSCTNSNAPARKTNARPRARSSGADCALAADAGGGCDAEKPAAPEGGAGGRSRASSSSSQQQQQQQQKRESRTSEFLRRACGDYCKRYRSKQILKMPTETATNVYRAVYTYTAEALAKVNLLRLGDELNRHLMIPNQPPDPSSSSSSSSSTLGVAAAAASTSTNHAAAKPRARATYGICEAFHGSNQGVNKSPWCLLSSVDVCDSAFAFQRAFAINEVPDGFVFVDRELSPIPSRKRMPVAASNCANLLSQQQEQVTPEPRQKLLKSVPTPATPHVTGTQTDIIHKLTVENEFLRQQVTYLASLAGVSYLFSPPALSKVRALPVAQPLLNKGNLIEQASITKEPAMEVSSRSKCPICLEEKPETMMWKLGCNHGVCHSCMKEFAHRILNGADNRCPICRFYLDDTYLHPFLTEEEIQQLQYYRDVEVSVSRASCSDYLEPSFPANVAWKRCPRCNVDIQRDMTNHIHCACKAEFCYLCGVQLSPSHDNACASGCNCWSVHFGSNGHCPLFCDNDKGMSITNYSPN